ncbi:trace amine-associated receptor 1-like [Antennarius striatus]|uniref:trace amine-associated receptor 1-like n=1 Tax=Antennarius striatus TaxID=241820 RepID=UPI0035B1B635
METKSFGNRSDDDLEDTFLCNNTTNDVAAVNTMYLFLTFLGLLSVFIMCGNLLVIISIIYFRQLRTPTNYLILSLAVADLLVGVLVLPLSIVSLIICGHLQNVICKLRGCFDIILCTCSILNLCSISVDRYYAVCQPLKYRAKVNIHVIMIMILLSWTVSALNGIIITILGVNQENSNMKKCVLFKNASSAILGTFSSFFLPAFIMSMIYVKILTEAQKQTRSIQNTTSQLTKTERKMERKATKTLAIIMGVFIVCWSPFFLSVAFNSLSHYKIPVPLIEAFKWLGWSNSMLNPFVYGFFYRWFRTAFRMIISGKIFQADLTNSKLH